MVHGMNVLTHNKLKLVFVAIFATPKRYVDPFVLKALGERFDLEWWDCADIVYPKYCDTDSGTPYVLKIHSIKELKRNLRRIPKDTLLVKVIPALWKNRHVDKLLAKYFPKIVLVQSYSNTPSPFKKTEKEAETRKTRSLLSIIKKPLYHSDTLKTVIKILFHPEQRHVLSEIWQINKEWSWFKEIVVINCAKGSEYHINHPDVEQYIRHQSSTKRRSDRYIVYIDQNFPYHLDLKIWQPNINVESLAHRFFPSINQFFSHLEKSYNCQVVVAVHPKAQYSCNPFEGREMVSFDTAALVRDSIGVCMHSSNALSYVVFYDKPVVSIVNDAIKEVERQYNQVVNMVNQWDVPFVDIDRPNYGEHPLSNLKPETRRQYMETFFGDLDPLTLQSNADLMTDHFYSIHERFYAKQQGAVKSA